MTTHFYTASSLDGFIATEEHSLEWLFRQNFDDQGPMAYPGFIESIGALVMGASTYEWLLEHQETWEYSQPTWVFTHRSLPVPERADVRFVEGHPRDHATAIEGSAQETSGQTASEQGRDVWIVGGGDLAGQFAEAGLLDELWVQFAPVTLGAGKPLFTRPLDLELLETARNRDFACLRYRVRKTR